MVQMRRLRSPESLDTDSARRAWRDLLWSYDEVFSALTEGWLEQFLRFINNGFRNKPVDDYSWHGAFYTDIEFHLPGLSDFADKKFFSEFGSYTERLVIGAMKTSSAASCKHRFQVD
jgi:hypothetical protein